MLLAVANGEMIPIYKKKKQKGILGPSTWYTDIVTLSHMRIRQFLGSCTSMMR